MSQINFRVNQEDIEIAKVIAKTSGVSLAEYARTTFLKEIGSKRIEIAFQLLAEGKCGFKRSWTISGLEYREFLSEWAKRGAVEILPEKMLENNYNRAMELDVSKLLKMG